MSVYYHKHMVALACSEKKVMSQNYILHYKIFCDNAINDLKKIVVMANIILIFNLKQSCQLALPMQFLIVSNIKYSRSWYFHDITVCQNAVIHVQNDI